MVFYCVIPLMHSIIVITYAVHWYTNHYGFINFEISMNQLVIACQTNMYFINLDILYLSSKYNFLSK